MNVALVIAIGLLVARLAIFAVLHIRHREFSPLRDTVSDYGTGATRGLYSAMGLLSLVGNALVLAVLLHLGATPGWAVALLGVAVVGSVLLLFVPTDRTGTAVTARERVHWLLAVVNFAGLFAFMTNVDVPGQSPPPTALTLMTWVVRVTFYAFLVTLVVPSLRRSVMGLAERAFLTATPCGSSCWPPC